ncbi:MAG: hypothetical protein MJ016_06845 [Victivallaceae bacterium]|nr:hypothetical protein [Victivallaceae bacterium]
MKRIKIFVAILFFGAALPVFAAAVGISVRLNRMNYMQYEPVYACVTIRNDTGRALLFGNDPRLQGFILFDIRGKDNRRVEKIPGKDISVTGLVIAPGEIKNMIIPIHKYYRLDRCGTYRVAAFISHNLLPDEYQSEDQVFRVESGNPVWTRTVGLPDLDGDGKSEIKTRTYSIRTLTESVSKYYYLVVEDETHVYGVLRIGQMVGREKFHAEIDMLSRIHLLMPLSPRIFHYLAFSLDGLNIENSYWRTSETIPMLYRDPSTGMVTRMGGVEAHAGVDFQDPDAGKLTASKLLTEEEKQQERLRRPKPMKDQGLIDIGKKLDIPIEKNDD